jgi:hypothetical protein
LSIRKNIIAMAIEAFLGGVKASVAAHLGAVDTASVDIHGGVAWFVKRVMVGGREVLQVEDGEEGQHAKQLRLRLELVTCCWQRALGGGAHPKKEVEWRWKVLSGAKPGVDRKTHSHDLNLRDHMSYTYLGLFHAPA